MTVAVELIEEHHRPKVGWLVRNLRSLDDREVKAVQFSEDPDMLSERIMMSKGFTWLVTMDGKPAAVYGASCLWPNNWQAFAFGTEDYPHVILSLTRHCKKFIVPALQGHGVRLVHCWVMAEYMQARQWILSTFPGAREECVVDGFGKDGEPFVLVTWRPQEAVTWAH